MIYNPQTLITAQNTAYTTLSFTGMVSNTVSFVAADLSSGENITVQVWANASSTPKWINYIINGVQQEMNANNPVLELSFNDSLVLRLVKPVTINEVGVSVNPNIQIGILGNGE
jgi:hypothetical protein